MEETKLDERNITENRTQRKNYIVNREENTDGNRVKIELKKMYSQLFGEEQSQRNNYNKTVPPMFVPILDN